MSLEPHVPVLAKMMVRAKDLTPLGIVDVRVCSSQDKGHGQQVATHVVHWATGPCDKCLDCAARMMALGDVLGYHVHVEPIDYPEVQALLDAHERQRAISLQGVPPT